MWRVLLPIALVACGHPRGAGDDTMTGDARGTDAIDVSGDGGDSGGGGGDDAGIADALSEDAPSVTTDAPPDAPAGVITGGPCVSGTAGATAYRIRWANGGGTAYPVYKVHGLPDKSRNKTGAYGYQIGFSAQYVDPFLAQGGVLLNGSSFIDLELSTVGVAQIAKATLSLYGRSYNTATSGSFNWQTFDGTGATPSSTMSNAAPYAWYPGDMTTEISPGDDGVLIRIKAGPASGSLVVNKIELCLQAS